MLPDFLVREKHYNYDDKTYKLSIQLKAFNELINRRPEDVSYFMQQNHA